MITNLIRILFLLLMICKLTCPNTKAQNRFSVGVETSLTLSSMNYHDAPGLGLSEPYKNYYGDWVIENPISGHFSMQPNIAFGFNTNYSFNRKLAWWNGVGLLVKSFDAGGKASLGYVGVTSLLQYKPLNKLSNLYVLGGLRFDKFLDYDGGKANRLLSYAEKTYELSPIIGVGYQVITTNWLQITTDVRFNPSLKNLLATVPWQGQNKYDSYAYIQTVMLSANFWFKKK